MNPVIGAQLKEYVRQSSLTAQDQSSQFEIYSIFCVLNGLLGESVDAYQVHLKGTEFGLDGVAVLIQGELCRDAMEASDKLSTIKNASVEFVFFQSKTGTSFDYGDISKFFDAISGFFSGEIEGESDDLDALIEVSTAVYEKGLTKKNPSISCYYITTGNYEESKTTERLRQNFVDSLKEQNIFDNDNIGVHFVGARQLQSWYRAATTAVEVEIDFPRNVVMPSNENVEEGYIGYVSVENLMKLCVHTDEAGHVVGVNRSVFFDNIRDYDPKSKINKLIKKGVIDGGRDDFVFRNNGITVVSKNIDRTGDKFRIEDFQIVNGCQTSNVIFDLVHGEDSEAAKDGLGDDFFKAMHVPFRLIGSKNDDFVSSIIVGTNSQNPVREEQFWAMKPFMKSFEEYCRAVDKEEAIFLERRDNQYRGQEVERTRIIQPSVLMKAVTAALLYLPHRAARDYKSISAEYGSTIMKDDDDVRLYHAISYLYYRIEFLWRNNRIETYLKTFRYYILTGIVMSLAASKDPLALKKQKIPVLANGIIEFAKNENALIDSVIDIGDLVEERLKFLKVTTQERIRDTIRSETFADTFRKRMASVVLSEAPSLKL